MNRSGLWAAGVVLILLVVVGAAALTTVGAGYAKDEDITRAKCSVATLDGTYPFAFDGVVQRVYRGGANAYEHLVRGDLRGGDLLQGGVAVETL